MKAVTSPPEPEAPPLSRVPKTGSIADKWLHNQEEPTYKGTSVILPSRDKVGLLRNQLNRSISDFLGVSSSGNAASGDQAAEISYDASPSSAISATPTPTETMEETYEYDDEFDDEFDDNNPAQSASPYASQAIGGEEEIYSVSKKLPTTPTFPSEGNPLSNRTVQLARLSAYMAEKSAVNPDARMQQITQGAINVGDQLKLLWAEDLDIEIEKKIIMHKKNADPDVKPKTGAFQRFTGMFKPKPEATSHSPDEGASASASEIGNSGGLDNKLRVEIQPSWVDPKNSKHDICVTKGKGNSFILQSEVLFEKNEAQIKWEWKWKSDGKDKALDCSINIEGCTIQESGSPFDETSLNTFIYVSMPSGASCVICIETGIIEATNF